MGWYATGSHRRGRRGRHIFQRLAHTIGFRAVTGAKRERPAPVHGSLTTLMICREGRQWMKQTGGA